MSQDYEDNSNEFWEKQRQIYKSAYVTLALLIINILVFVAGTTITPWFYSKGAMYSLAVLNEGQFYRVVTSMFLHADINHLFNNMMMLGLVGAIIEQYTGHIVFFILYFLSGIFGNLLSMAYEMRNDLNWVSLGASGAIMGLVGFMVVWLVIYRKLLMAGRSMLFRLLLLGLFVIEACFFQKGANLAAHLGGFLTGFVFGIINIVLFNNRKNMEGIV
jgi:rhomboid protease GluP